MQRWGDSLGVRLALPDVPERRVAKLCSSARLAHQRFAHRYQAPKVAVPQPPAVVEL